MTVPVLIQLIFQIPFTLEKLTWEVYLSKIDFPDRTIKQLREKGHNLFIEPEWSLGRMTAASSNNGIFKAAANPRYMQGYAIGR